MKKRLLLVLILLTTAIQGFSQTKGISYQAVILNPNPQEIPGVNAQGNLLANSGISIQFTIINSSGTEEYQEKHSTRTDRYGMINLLIGTGTPTGSKGFTNILWNGTVKKLKVAIDFTAGNNFSPLSEQNLTYMPQPPTQETTIEIASNTAAIATETARAKFAEQTNAAAIALNTAKTGITAEQASAIVANTAKVGYTDALVSANAAVAANTAKVGITSAQATTISNTTGVNTGDQDISGIVINAGAITTLQGEQITQDEAIALNTAKTGITAEQASAIAANTTKVGYTDALVSANAAVAANTAKVGINSAQATKLAGIADGAEVNVQADWNQATTTADDYIKNKPTIPAAADGSETKVTAGTNVTLTGIGTTASPYVVNATGGSGAVLTIGQSYQGGKIFWLDATGQHGLIAATADQSAGIQWYNSTYKLTGTTGDGLYAGAMNTAMIVAQQMADDPTGNFAAKVCADYSVNDGVVTYGDWYLPSIYELNLMYLNIGHKNALLGNVGGFASDFYWSSTETDLDNAWVKDFYDGLQGNYFKYFTFFVRAVRAF